MPLLAAPLVAISICAPTAAQPLAPHSMISRCASQAPAGLKGLAALRRACPGIGRAIDSLGIDAFLPPKWRHALTPRSLAGFDELVRHYSGSPPPMPDAGALRAIARSLKLPAPPPSLWDRVKAWIGHWTDPLRKMFDRWLRSLGRKSGSHDLLAAFFVIAMLLLLALAVLVILELRSAGLLGASRRPARRRGPTDTTKDESVLAETPDWTVLREQPAQLLRVLIDALTRSRRIARDRHLTCRELSSQARFDSENQQKGFIQIALLAERALYGPGEAPPVPAETLRAAKALHVELQTTPARREAAAP